MVVGLAKEVGRMGGAIVSGEVVGAGQLAPEPQRRPLVQQPPPREAGQDWKPGEQVRGRGARVLLGFGVAVVGDVLGIAVVVVVDVDVNWGVERDVVDARVLVLDGREAATVSVW